MDTLFTDMQLKPKGRKHSLMFQTTVVYNEAIVTEATNGELTVTPVPESGWNSFEACKIDVLKRAAAKGVSVKLYGDPDMPQRFVTDPVALRITKTIPNVRAVFVEYCRPVGESQREFVIIVRQELAEDVDAWKADVYA